MMYTVKRKCFYSSDSAVSEWWIYTNVVVAHNKDNQMSIIGKTIKGYKIIEFIDSGGFGSVYKAEKDGIIYAIKIFREDYVLKEYREKGGKNRIKREIDIMKSVSHPNLIKYIDDFKEILSGVPSYFLILGYKANKRKYWL